jgi:hypothetical protein
MAAVEFCGHREQLLLPPAEDHQCFVELRRVDPQKSLERRLTARVACKERRRDHSGIPTEDRFHLGHPHRLPCRRVQEGVSASPALSGRCFAHERANVFVVFA